MTKFKLKEQRRKLFSSLQGKAFDLMWLFKKLNEQDKEFIRLLKEDFEKLNLKDGELQEIERIIILKTGDLIEDKSEEIE